MRAILLIDDEKRHSDFKADIGRNSEYVSWPSTMCRMPTKAERGSKKLFDFETFSLMVTDDKLTNYVKLFDGVIIVVEDINYNNKILNRIVEIYNLLLPLHKPLLIVVEKSEVYRAEPIKTIPITNLHTLMSQYCRVFYVDYSSGEKYSSDIARKPAEWLNSTMKYNKDKLHNPIKQDTEDTKDTKTESESAKPMKVYMPNTISKDIPLTEYIKQFEGKTLPLDKWDHYGRLRIVSYSLVKHGYTKTIDPNGWLCTNWKAYKESIGHNHLWNYTLTRFWANILFELIANNKYESFYEMYDANKKIQNGKLFQQYYSNAVLFSDKARETWVPPDLLFGNQKALN